MIAEIVPYTKTIRGKDYFDYAIPEDIGDVSPGMIVSVPFRKKEVPGLVLRIKDSSSVSGVLPISAVNIYERWGNASDIAFLQWFADFYAVSLAHAWKTLYPKPLKRPRSVELHLRAPHSSAHAQPTSTLRTTDMLALRYSERSDVLQHYNELAGSTLGNMMIIVPEHRFAKEVANAVTTRNVVVLGEHSSPSELMSIRKHLAVTEEPCVVIGTRSSIFIQPSAFDVLIIDQEHFKTHKQYDMNPRYHTRDIAFALHEFFQTRIIFSGTSLSVTLEERIRAGVVDHQTVSRDWTSEHIHIVDMSVRQDSGTEWFSEDFLSAIAASSKAFVFFNRIGSFAMQLCTDCDSLVDMTVASCTECGNIELKTIRKGVQQLEQELLRQFPNKNICRIDSESSTEQSSLADASIIIGTEKALPVLEASAFDVLGIVSVDHQLVYPHFQAQERTYALLTRLFTSGIQNIILQTYNPSHLVIRAAVSMEPSLYLDEELDVRKSLRLPPYANRFRLIHRQAGTEQVVRALPSLLPKDTLVDRVT